MAHYSTRRYNSHSTHCAKLSPFLGSGPDRGRCPIEHRGKFRFFVNLYIRMSVWLPLGKSDYLYKA